MKIKNNFEIVLFEPEIPQNTGNVIRTCVALDIKINLIKPLGFSLEEKYLKRAALDYFKKAEITLFENFDDFLKTKDFKKSAFYFYSRYGLKDYTKANYKLKNKTIYLIFGKESTGIPKTILKNNIKYVYRIPTTDKVRSINLSNSAAVVAFFASYKNKFKNLSYYEPQIYKGKNYLKNIEEELLNESISD